MTQAACESIHRPGGFVITDRALEFCDFKVGARLLDVGCGSGATVRHVRQKYAFDIRGFDKAPEAVGGQRHLLCACGENLPVPDGEMDGALLECSLSVMDDPDLVLKECHRVLKPGGYLMISDLYARGEAARLQGCLGRVDTQEMLLAMVVRHGFTLALFEDYSEHLRALWGQRVFEKGRAAFCCELGVDTKMLKAVNCGYCLIIARKGSP